MPDGSGRLNARRVILSISAALSCLTAAAEGPLEPIRLQPIDLATRPVALRPDTLSGVRLLGAYAISSRDERFGGISGVEIIGDQLVAVSDHAFWVLARVDWSASGLQLHDARLAKMFDTRSWLDGDDMDAEGLDWDGRRLRVSFERNHRVMVLGDNGRLSAARTDPTLDALEYNEGPEGLASLPDGRVLLLIEGRGDDGVPVLIYGPGGLERRVLPISPPHKATAADVGPDGRLYVVLRHYAFLTGISVRLMRFHLGDDGFPEPLTGETLASFDSASGIDNMESISVWRDAAGRIRLTLMSDDNFNLFQRTLLLDMALED